MTRQKPTSRVPSPSSPEPTLVELLRGQSVCYQRLHELSLKQRERVGEEDRGPLLEILNQRQKVVDALIELGRAIEPFSRRWPACLQTLPEAEQVEVLSLVQRIGQLRSAVLDRDRHDAETLSDARRRLSDEMARLDQGRRVSLAYRPGAVAAAPRFADARG